PAGEQAAVGDCQFVGAFLRQVDIEGAAIAADAAVLRLHFGTVRRDHLQLRGRPWAHTGWAARRSLLDFTYALQAQWEMFEVEEVVGNGRIHGDPGVIAGQDSG